MIEPCPFCGSEEVSASRAPSDDPMYRAYQAKCKDCKACGPEVYSTFRSNERGLKKAIDEWNNR